MGIRTTAAVLSARALSFACRIAGKQGVTMAGKLAMRIDPLILKKLASQVRGDIIVTCVEEILRGYDTPPTTESN